MNPQTAVLTILFGLAILFAPMTVPALTFEQRWEPVKQLPPMIDKSPRELTFEERWEPVRRMLPMLPGKADRDDTPPQGIVRAFHVTRQVEGTIPGGTPILPTHAFIRDETTVRLKPRQDVSIRVDAPSSLPPEHPVARKVVTETRKVPKRVAVLDICQRHNMRKVHYGRTWRCQK